jgi:glycosyltransferase involved in cell wall biosynthesis
MRIAFIVQRYGAEILGGSEYHCRLVAERMAGRHDVEVLTTCARDYVSWKNEYAEGTDRVRGVTIRRFASAQPRDIQAFNQYSDWIFNFPHTRDDEMEWLRRQGPWCPALIEYLERNHRSYDVLIFFTYLYAPTVLGLRVAPERSILVPTAHDEPAIRLSIYRELFQLPAAIAYNTETERRFLQGELSVRAHTEETVGCGVDLPASVLASVERATDAEHGGRRGPRDRDRDRDRLGGRPQGEAPAAVAAPEPTAGEEEEDALNTPRFRSGRRGERFRRRHRLFGDLVLYGGRIDPGKGCEELFEYFAGYREQGGTATLALMGVKLMAIPDAPYLRFAGQLSDEERAQALEAATVIVVPSPYESLSLLALEAFAVGTPILANGRSDVLVDHCRRSNAGLYYESRDEFVEALSLLITDQRLRGVMGRNGRDYVEANYRWDVILAKYDRLIAGVRRG